MKQTLLAGLLLSASVGLAADHVGFVNVNKAIDPGLFADVISNSVTCSTDVSYRIDAVERIDVAALVAKAAQGYPKDERKISVYFVNDASLPPQVVSPGFFAVINVRGLDKDADAAKFRTRLVKMGLKGLAFSCGFGANQDIGRCVMAAGSFETLKGIDGTSATYSPFCYFPLCEYLRARNLVAPPPVNPEDE